MITIVLSTALGGLLFLFIYITIVQIFILISSAKLIHDNSTSKKSHTVRGG